MLTSGFNKFNLSLTINRGHGSFFRVKTSKSFCNSSFLYQDIAEHTKKQEVSYAILVTDIENNLPIRYSSIRKAALAINTDVKSFSHHVSSKSELGLKTLYKNRYIVSVLRSNSIEGKVSRVVDITKLEPNKLFVYNADKTLAFVFDNYGQACRVLTPERCKNLSDLDLAKNKNLQHIRRVVNKGTLTKTETGLFYLFANPNLSTCLDLIL